jgi:hypothetical protein
MQDSNQTTQGEPRSKGMDTPDTYEQIRSYAFEFKSAFPTNEPIAVIFDRAALLRILNIAEDPNPGGPATIGGIFGYHTTDKRMTVSLLRVFNGFTGYAADPEHVKGAVKGEQIWPAYVPMDKIDILLPAPDKKNK